MAAAAPDALTALVERYDTEILDLPRAGARVRLTVRDGSAWDAELDGRGARLVPARGTPDAELAADSSTWRRLGRDLTGGMDAYRRGRLRIRHNLHLGVGFLAATSGDDGPGRLTFDRVQTEFGTLSTMQAGEGPPVVLLHGLGGTKVSFLPTIAALAGSYRLIAVDLPGFGDSDKPVGAYDPPFFARWIGSLFDTLALDRAHLVGHSLGGRAALEVAFRDHERIDRLVLMTPSLAWLRDRPWGPYLRLLRPELGFIQPAPKVITDRIVRRVVPGSAGAGWSAAAVDEFMRSYLTPRGRVAFYAAARQIYLEDPEIFWRRLETLAPEALFIWGRRDPLVPAKFMRHVQQRLPAAEHVELSCGHVPQIERPRELHAAIGGFLGRADRRMAVTGA